MKKGSKILLSVCALSLCLLLGIFIGRNLMGNYAQLPENTATQAAPTKDKPRDHRLDINECSELQLMELPGIGEVLAQRIIDYREVNGPYSAVEDLMNVEGIGQKKLEAIEAYIKVGG